MGLFFLLRGLKIQSTSNHILAYVIVILWLWVIGKVLLCMLTRFGSVFDEYMGVRNLLAVSRLYSLSYFFHKTPCAPPNATRFDWFS
jgi:hypothetical protein